MDYESINKRGNTLYSKFFIKILKMNYVTILKGKTSKSLDNKILLKKIWIFGHFTFTQIKFGLKIVFLISYTGLMNPLHGFLSVK